MSTANPTGQRPWNFAWQTSQQALSGPRRLRGMRLSAFDPRVRTLNGPGRGFGRLRGLGDTAQNMIATGYSSGDINTLVALGATDAQLQYLANFPPDSAGYTSAYASLMGTLTGTPAGVSSSSIQYQAIPVAPGVVEIAPGVYQASPPGLNIAPGITAPNPSNPAATVDMTGTPLQQVLGPWSLAPSSTSNTTTPQTPSWWTDPNQSMIPGSGIPNMLIIGGGAILGFFVVEPTLRNLVKKF